jgi:hypothetical protein
MATLYNLDDILKLEKKLAIIQFQALVINDHFPWAILYGPCELDGMDLATLQAMLLQYVKITFYTTPEI